MKAGIQVYTEHAGPSVPMVLAPKNCTSGFLVKFTSSKANCHADCDDCADVNHVSRPLALTPPLPDADVAVRPPPLR